MATHSREATWLVIRRCLAIVRRLQQGPATRPELVEAVLAQVDAEAYGLASGEPLKKRFRRDLDRIRTQLGIDVAVDRRTYRYSIQDLEQPLLNLPDEDLQAIAWLEQTFGPGTPQHELVQGLLNRLRFYLPAERRAAIERQRTGYVLELGQQDDDRLDPAVELKLQTALARRVRVELDYLSPRNESGEPRRHVVDIFEPPRFEPTLGHYYVRGWCHYNEGPEGRFTPEHYITYRLGRISRVTLLPDKLPPAPPRPRRYRVEYWLSARVARQGVTRRRWIDIERIEPQPDESAVVYGVTDDLFFALQELMHYRQHCQVRGGPELLARMKKSVKKMAENYGI